LFIDLAQGIVGFEAEALFRPAGSCPYLGQPTIRVLSANAQQGYPIRPIHLIIPMGTTCIKPER